MKYSKIVAIFFILLITSCSAQNFSEINYKAHTRGSTIEIVVKNNTIKYRTNNNKKEFKLAKEEIKHLNEIIKGISLKEIEELESPTNKRFSDGALIANFRIVAENKKYTSSAFDAGNPPKELKKLEDFLYSLIKLKE